MCINNLLLRCPVQSILSVCDHSRRIGASSWGEPETFCCPSWAKQLDNTQQLKFLCLCSLYQTTFTVKLVKPATFFFSHRPNTVAHSEVDRRMRPKIWHAPGAGQCGIWEEAARGKGSYWWRKFGKVVVWAWCCCLCSGAKLAGVKGRTAKSPNPEQICPANCTTLQKVSLPTTSFISMKWAQQRTF